MQSDFLLSILNNTPMHNLAM